MINMDLDDNTIIKFLNISKEDLDNIKGSRLQLLFPFFISISFNSIFIFVFFAGNIFLPVYFTYFTLAHSFSAQRKHEIKNSFEEFCTKYEVSPRESDVIKEICNGLSNKEISDKLFISLQTVKDHTHHIYIKTNVKSRVQLINLVKEEIQEQTEDRRPKTEEGMSCEGPAPCALNKLPASQRGTTDDSAWESKIT